MTSAHRMKEREKARYATEDHFLLQVPDDIAQVLRRTPEQMGITFEDETDVEGVRYAQFRIGERELPAKLMRLPTVIETHKSLDGTTFYKTGMVGQVLVVAHSAAELPGGAECEDGVTPPTGNIRRRKWRKRPARDPLEVQQAALELEALLRGGPLKPEYELIDVEEEMEVPIEDDESSQGLGSAHSQGLGPGPSEVSQTPGILRLKLGRAAVAEGSTTSAAEEEGEDEIESVQTDESSQQTSQDGDDENERPSSAGSSVSRMSDSQRESPLSASAQPDGAETEPQPGTEPSVINVEEEAALLSEIRAATLKKDAISAEMNRLQPSAQINRILRERMQARLVQLQEDHNLSAQELEELNERLAVLRSALTSS